MDTPLSPFWFRFMTVMLCLRDLYISPGRRLREAGCGPGVRLLDFGCGPGAYALKAAEMAGPEGRVYALDLHPLAGESINRRAKERGLANITFILSDCATGLEDGSVDVVVFYDTLHLLGDPGAVLKEFHRVLRPGGALSAASTFMKKKTIIDGIGGTGLFAFRGKAYESLLFSPREK